MDIYMSQLGDHSPQTLVDTMVFMNGMYFALRSGGERLRHDPSQIELIEKPGERAYLKCTEDISKNHPRRLKGRKHNPKVVLHHKTTNNPSHCFICLFKIYQSKCPPDRPPDVFYLKVIGDSLHQDIFASIKLFVSYLTPVPELVPKFIEPSRRGSYTKKVIYAKRLSSCFLTGGLQIYTNSGPAQMSE
jgi:hypothetical protein